MIWDLESKSVVEELKPVEAQGNKNVYCLSLAWSADGQTLFGGYTDNSKSPCFPEPFPCVVHFTFVMGADVLRHPCLPSYAELLGLWWHSSLGVVVSHKSLLSINLCLALN
jgi:hypothetical protein